MIVWITQYCISSRISSNFIVFPSRYYHSTETGENMLSDVAFKINDKDLKANIFLELVQRVWPGTYSEQFTDEALGITINITAWIEGKLVGCVRILTDGYYFGTITEILVLPEYRG